MNRMNKIEDLLHKEIASIILTRIDNPKIKNTVTITDIKVSKDIRNGIVFFTTLDDNYKKIYRQIQGVTGRKPVMSFKTEDFNPINQTYESPIISKVDYIKSKMVSRNTIIYLLIFFIIVIFFIYTQPQIITYDIDENTYGISYSKLLLYSIIISSIISCGYYYFYGFRY